MFLVSEKNERIIQYGVISCSLKVSEEILTYGTGPEGSWTPPWSYHRTPPRWIWMAALAGVAPENKNYILEFYKKY